MVESRVPRWRKWKLMTEVKAWEAVSLSLGIEPDCVATDPLAWMGAKYPFDEGIEFNDRLDVLLTHVFGTDYFTPCRFSSTNYDSHLLLSEFVEWAERVAKWSVPPELLAIPGSVTLDATSAKAQESNPTPLTRRDMVQLDWPIKDPQKRRAFFSGLSDVPKWLEPARVQRGAPGKGSNLWNPAIAAALLVERGTAGALPMARFISESLPAWEEEWKRTQEQPAINGTT